jgi:protein TonB
MLAINTSFINNKNSVRIAFSLFVAVIAHMVIFYGIANFQAPNTLKTEELLNIPTKVTINFLSPIQPIKFVEAAKPTPAKPVIQKKNKTKTVHKSKPKKATTKKVAVKKQVVRTKPIPQQQVALNQIEPAAASVLSPQPVRTPITQNIATPTPPAIIQPAKSTPKTIPVVSGNSLKGRRIQPNYPERALRMKQQGTVWLHVLIAENGKREEIKIHKPTQYALLNQAAVKAVKKWTFSPNMVNGIATKSWVEIPIEFKIQ